MALEKKVLIDKIEVMELGQIQVRELTRVLEDGMPISESYKRWSFAPGEDVSNQDARVKAICNAVWTPEVIASYNQFMQDNSLKLNDNLGAQ